MDARAEIKKGLSAKIVLPPDLDMLNDRLRPALVINGDEYPLGEYLIATLVENTDAAKRKSASIEAYDGGYLPQRYKAETRPFFAAGEAYTNIIQALLIESGVEKISIAPSFLVLPADREDWEIGTPYIEMINQLLGEINYTTLWFDNNGFARAGRAALAAADNIKHTYRRGAYSVKTPEETTELDIFNKCNVFMALVDNADMEAPMIATAVNDNPASILSVQRRGRVQAPIERLDNIANQEELQAYVNGVRDKSQMTVRTTKIETALMPGHEVGDIVALDDGIYREVAWEMSLGPDGMMRHTLEREVFL